MEKVNEQDQVHNCNRCQQKYDTNGHKPKFLGCFHSFCKNCVETATSGNQYKCPIDGCENQQETPVKGVDGLPDNFFTQLMIDNDVTDAEKVIDGDQALNRNQICSKHEKLMTSFCTKETCQRAICEECVNDHPPAYGHSTVSLAGAAEQCSKELQCSIRDMRVCSKQWTRLRDNKAKEMEQIAKTKEAVDTSIHDFFENCYKEIKEREQKALECAHKYSMEMTEYVDLQNKRASVIKSGSNRIENLVQMAMKHGDPVGLLQSKDRIMGIMHELSVSPEGTQVIGPKMMCYDAVEHAQSKLSEYVGGLSQLHFNAAVPYLSYCDDTIAFLDFQCTVAIHVVDYKGAACTQGRMNITVVVKAPKTSTDVPCQLYNMKDGMYELKFTPKVSGTYVAHVLLNGTQIKRSPLSIPTCTLKNTVHPQILEKPSKVILTSIDSTRKSKRMPANLPIQAEVDCPSGEVKTCDVTQVNDKMYQILYIPTELGEHKLYIGMKKTVVGDSPVKLMVKQYLAAGHTDVESGKLIRPSAIAVNSNGYIYVADTSRNKRIQKYDTAYTRIGFIEVDSQEASSLVIDKDDNVIILFRVTKYIEMYDAAGNKFKHFELGTVKNPIGLAVNRMGRIFVTDCVLHRVFKLDYDGNVLKEFGDRGGEPGQFDTPVDVCCQNDTIFICDRYNNRVQQLNEEGECIQIFNCEERSFDMPAAVAITSDGQLVVFDAEQTTAVIIDIQSKDVVKIVPCFADVGKFEWESLVATNDGMLLKVCTTQDCFRVYKI